MIPTDHMTRREFVATVGGAAVGATLEEALRDDNQSESAFDINGRNNGR